MSLTHMQIKELLDENLKHECEGFGPDKVCVRIAAIGELPSRFGDFHILSSLWLKKKETNYAIAQGRKLITFGIQLVGNNQKHPEE